MPPLKAPSPDLQVTFFSRLQELRHTLLLDALLEAVASSNVGQIDKQLGQFVTATSLRRVASWGLRGELLFPVPCLLEPHPRLLGFYRLLLGFSQKQFYGKQYGFGAFQSMEISGRCSPSHRAALPELCSALCKSSEILIAGTEHLSQGQLHELTLLTLGAQLRGGALNVLGADATQQVFRLIKEIVASHIAQEEETTIRIRNASGRLVEIKFGRDPDIKIRETLQSGKHTNLIAVEIKGGADYSNIHNRLGEAEKSHQKARNSGFVECWTLVGVSGLDLDLARKESPTTDRFFVLDGIRLPTSEDGVEFRELLRSRLGIKD